MIKIIIVIFLIQIFAINSLFGQEIYKTKIDSMKYISDMPYICRDSINSPGCGQTAFWTIVAEKKEIIPYILEILDDTTKTEAIVPNVGGRWTIADIGYNALQEIIKDIPTFELLGVPFDKDGCGYCSYWNHLRLNIDNRMEFKKNVTEWYDATKTKLTWIEDHRTLTCDCSFQHPNNGHFELKK